MPIPLLVPLAMAGAAAAGQAVKALSSKTAADYMNESGRNDLQANSDNTAAPGTSTYQRYDPGTGSYVPLVDRGNSSDRFSALNDPNSSMSAAFELGGRAGYANQLANAARQTAERVGNMAPVQANLADDAALANTQQGLLNMYAAGVSGAGPSVAALGARNGVQNTIRNMNAMRASGSLANQRAAMLQGTASTVDTGAGFANRRLGETMEAANQFGGLSNSMSNMALGNGLRQAKLDLSGRANADALANQYYQHQQAIQNAQFQGYGSKAAAMLDADKMRKQEVMNEAEGKADRHNRDVNTGLGIATAGLSAAGSVIGKK